MKCTNDNVFILAPYANGIYEIIIETSTKYPMEPPNIRFITKVFHPNVHFKEGGICLDILKLEWSPAWTLMVNEPDNI